MDLSQTEIIRWETIVVGIIFTLSLFLGFTVYSASKKEGANRYFLGIVLSIAFLILFAYLSEFFPKTEPQISLILSKLVFALAILLMIFFFFFSYVFPINKKLPNHYFWSSIIIGLILIFISLFTPLIVKDIKLQPWGFDLVYGIFYTAIVLPLLVFLTILSFLNLVLNYRVSNKAQKKQLLFIFVGLGLFLLLGVFFGGVLPFIVKSQEYYRIGNYSAIVFVGFTAYAIVKKQLFDIRVIAAETLVALITLGLLIDSLISKTFFEGGLKGILFVLVSYGGYRLIFSVHEEIKRRQEIANLAAQLEQANEHLKELDQMKTEFVSLASHELLTPVSAIEGYLSMIIDEKMVKISDPKAIQFLDRVYTSAKRLARLIADMLNISRIEQGRLLVEKADVDLSDLIKQVVDEMTFKAQERKQRVVFATPNSWKTYGDADKLKEIIINILGNAVKYSKEPGTITISVQEAPTAQIKEHWDKIEADIKARPLDDQEAIKSAVDPHYRDFVGDQQLLISIKDEGIGIPKEELPRLFKKFHRVGDFSTAESQGTGLGLYISRALVELHHGRIWADSEGPSHGSTFSFTMPLLENKDKIIELEKQIPQTKEQLKPLARPAKVAEEF